MLVVQSAARDAYWPTCAGLAKSVGDYLSSPELLFFRVSGVTWPLRRFFQSHGYATDAAVERRLWGYFGETSSSSDVSIVSHRLLCPYAAAGHDRGIAKNVTWIGAHSVGNRLDGCETRNVSRRLDGCETWNVSHRPRDGRRETWSGP